MTTSAVSSLPLIDAPSTLELSAMAGGSERLGAPLYGEVRLLRPLSPPESAYCLLGQCAMHATGRDPKAAIAERYAAKAAKAERQGDHRRAAELYRAAFRALEGREECDADPPSFAFDPVVREAGSGVTLRSENDAEDTTDTGTRPQREVG